MAAAAAVLIAGSLGACQKKETATETTTTTANDTVITSTAPTEATTPAVANAAVTVPEMKPTGDLNPAVNPGDPSKKSPGVAPTMAPTGNERLPYKEGATGK
jgi:hypothetical protein